MPPAIFCILGALVEMGGFGDIYQIAAYSGYEIKGIPYYSGLAVEKGWISHPRYGTYLITERGKIALAIETGRIRRRAGKNQAPMTVKKFAGAA